MNSSSSKISLYIHIPFCSSKCKYCDFYSETSEFERIPLVITQIIEQLKYNYKKLNYPSIETIFIGGGTPSILPISDLTRLLSYISSIAPEPLEWSIESNPESITREFLECCQSFGVNRLSIGIQSFNSRLLDTLGREAKKNDIDRAFKLIKGYWKGEVNLDLISSIPYQSRDIVIDDVKKALKLNPDHISFYALSLEEGTVLEDEVSKGVIDELPEESSEDIWFSGRNLILNSGYNNYEVSNYTKERPCLHNINYWELKPYLGIGPGAVSTLINKEGEIKRITNTKSIKTFLLGRDSMWGESDETIPPIEFLKEYIIMGLRLKSGINKIRFNKIFNRTIDSIISITPDLINRGLICSSRDDYHLTGKGFDIMNSVVVEILEALESVKIDRVNWKY